MTEPEQRMIAVCGLDCTDCDLRRAPTSAQAAQRVIDWFRSEGWLDLHEGLAEILRRGLYCQGCRGDRSQHWSPDCAILTCCLDKKELASCHECADFSCPQLDAWSDQGTRYAAALARLRWMRARQRTQPSH